MTSVAYFLTTLYPVAILLFVLISKSIHKNAHSCVSEFAVESIEGIGHGALNNYNRRLIFYPSQTDTQFQCYSRCVHWHDNKKIRMNSRYRSNSFWSVMHENERWQHQLCSCNTANDISAFWSALANGKSPQFHVNLRRFSMIFAFLVVI